MNRSEAGKLGFLKSWPLQEAKHKDFVAAYYQEPKRCGFCNEVISFEKRLNDYCNHSCAAKKINQSRTCVRKKQVEPHPCKSCGKITKNEGCCSSKCAHLHLDRVFIEDWLGGKQSGVTCGGMDTSTRIKRWLRKNRGDSCELCGWCEKNPVTGRVPLLLDHTDGNPENNRPENLRLLCPNCHSLTPTFGGLNRGNGRKRRYMKVLEGSRIM